MQIAETASTYPIQCGCLAYDVHWLATKRTLFGDTLGPLCDSVRPFCSLSYLGVKARSVYLNIVEMI